MTNKKTLLLPGPVKHPITVVTLGQQAMEMKGDEEFDFISLDGKPLGRGQIIAVWAGPLNIVPASLLESHHDPACRTYSGLVLTLQLLHGEKVVLNDKVVVSVMQFRLIGGEILLPSHKV